MNNKGEIVIYKSKQGSTKLSVTLDKDTVWLTQKQMSTLFNKDIKTINEHIRNIFKEGELAKNSVIWKSQITASDGKTYKTYLYNLDVIISVGYRVKSKEGTMFRIWATKVLRDYILKGVTLNYDRLKQIEDNFEIQKESYELLRSRIEKYLSHSARRDVVNAIDDKIDKLREDFEGFKLSLKEVVKK
ncbi:MAG: virulence RhuM family protein [Endomicrobiales bacterium]|nr:virulence RhuM family protein [Endomicrobiales bacterium]